MASSSFGADSAQGIDASASFVDADAHAHLQDKLTAIALVVALTALPSMRMLRPSSSAIVISAQPLQ